MENKKTKNEIAVEKIKFLEKIGYNVFVESINGDIIYASKNLTIKTDVAK